MLTRVRSAYKGEERLIALGVDGSALQPKLAEDPGGRKRGREGEEKKQGSGIERTLGHGFHMPHRSGRRFRHEGMIHAVHHLPPSSFLHQLMRRLFEVH